MSLSHCHLVNTFRVPAGYEKYSTSLLDEVFAAKPARGTWLKTPRLISAIGLMVLAYLLGTWADTTCNDNTQLYFAVSERTLFHLQLTKSYHRPGTPPIRILTHFPLAIHPR
jgi:hypothetical protein